MLVWGTKTYFIGSFSRATRVHQYRVWIGLLDTIQYDKETDTYRLKQLIIHEKYDAATYENDIALLELKGHGKGECSLKYSTPACVPWSEHMFKAGDKCKVSGWGLEKGIWFSATIHSFNSLLPECIIFIYVFQTMVSSHIEKAEEWCMQSTCKRLSTANTGCWHLAVGIWLSILFFVLLPLVPVKWFGGPLWELTW